MHQDLKEHRTLSSVFFVCWGKEHAHIRTSTLAVLNG